jgi:hypothetical protein
MSSLAAVRDPDCIASFVPLRFDYSNRTVTGPDAVLRRVLYRWCSLRGTVRHAEDLGLITPLFDIEGATFSLAGLDGLKAALVREALAVDFVIGAGVTLTLTGSGKLVVSAAITLVDGRTYPLEVVASAASAALLALGGSA